jgi:hypothetical protein
VSGRDAPTPEPAPRRLFVFSHPNHELAVFGLVRRWQPHLLFLTDGGGEERVAQTRRGLESIGLGARARFLDRSEQSLYDALLRRDAGFFAVMATEVRQAVADLGPDEVYADAVEFYNPVHDVTLPIVTAALRGTGRARVLEVPLVYQRPGGGETYTVQRAPASYGARRIDVPLTADELAAKEHARDTIYGLLAHQMGPILSALPRAHLAVEEVAMAATGLAQPGTDRTLRYEWRGALRQRRAEVTDVITYAGHYVPVVSPLLAS